LKGLDIKETAKRKVYIDELEDWKQYETEDMMGFCMPDAETMKTKGQALYK